MKKKYPRKKNHLITGVLLPVFLIVGSMGVLTFGLNFALAVPVLILVFAGIKFSNSKKI